MQPTQIVSRQLIWRRNTVQIKWLVEPRDLWIGLYWKRYPKAIDLYICILPALPLNVYIRWA